MFSHNQTELIFSMQTRRILARILPARVKRQAHCTKHLNAETNSRCPAQNEQINNQNNINDHYELIYC